MVPSILGASSWWGPALCAGGASSLVLAVWFYGIRGQRTIFPASPEEEMRVPLVWERVSVHLIAFGGWALVFGAVIWRGVPANMIDVHFAFERGWPVWEQAEWVYLSVYLVPAAMPWCVPTRGALRRFVVNLFTLLLLSVPFFLLLPLGSPPRDFTPSSLSGEILAWETRRRDFAAVSFPSFHVFWGLLVAQVLQSLGRGWAIAGWLWAIAVTAACIATGAHALVDVAASLVLFPLATAKGSVLARGFQAVAERFFNSRTMTEPRSAPTITPPIP
jgi:PAP2 superfamily